MLKNNQGRLIVIDGGDASGKKTQAQLIANKLRKKGYAVEETDFPRYYKNVFGKLIGELQKRTDIDFSKEPPELVAPLYAIDRFESKVEIEGWLSEGKIVITDRYVSANQLHQAGKIQDEEKRKNFLDLLDTLEHKIFQIPRPDLVIFLNVPHKISARLMTNADAGDKKKYSNNEIDRVEQDVEYQINAREIGIKMLTNKTWAMVECSDDGETILPKEVIHERVLKHCLRLLD